MVSHFILFNNVVFELKLSRALLFLYYVLIEVLKQSKQTAFLFLLYLFLPITVFF